MSVAAPPQAVPTPDVLPSGVRGRAGRRQAVLAAVLLAELLAGVGLRAAWNARDTIAALGQPRPVAVVRATGPVEALPPVVVAPSPAAPTPPAPLRRTVPRNPFAVQLP